MMHFKANLGKRKAWLLLLIVCCALLAGCIAEPPTPMQVVPEIIVPPAGISFKAINYIPHSTPVPKGQMLVTWNRSAADTQLNFKGYFIRVWTADTTNYSEYGRDNVDMVVDTVTVFRPYTAPGIPVKRTDTTYTFTSLIGTTPKSGLPLGTYLVAVYGEKTSASDTTIYSLDSTFYVGLFDPLPLESPTNLRATSYGAQNVLLRWTAPVTDKDTGLFQYVVYYRDTTLMPFDTGHIAATVPIPHPNVGNDSMVLVTVPAANSSTSQTAEWPYEFWVKAERNDSTFFYGADMYGLDTNHITWAGAEACPKTYPGSDSIPAGDTISDTLPVWGGFHNSLFFGYSNGQWDMVDDSTPTSPNGASAQVELAINPSTKTVTLTTANGATFLGPSANNATYDTTPSLDSLFYTYPFVTPSSTFAANSFTLPNPPHSTGIVLYLRMIDPNLNGAAEYARLFIQRLSNGTFLNASNGIHCQSSFQPGVGQGQAHLPYY
jgi:hypothetical protein